MINIVAFMGRLTYEPELKKYTERLIGYPLSVSG